MGDGVAHGELTGGVFSLGGCVFAVFRLHEVSSGVASVVGIMVWPGGMWGFNIC